MTLVCASRKVRVGRAAQNGISTDPGQKDCFATVVSVKARGRTYSQRVLAPQGFDPQTPITTEQVERKFQASVPSVVGQQQSARAFWPPFNRG